MTRRPAPRLWSIPPGVAFLPTLADALMRGDLVEGFVFDGDPMRLADVTIYVPTRRAARALRSVFVEKMGGASAILPAIRPLGDFDEEAGLFEADGGTALDLAPPVGALDRLLFLAPLLRRWKSRLPAHVAAMFEEDIVVPASTADAIWLARDLAALMDEIETEDADWNALSSLVGGDLSAWWQVTLDFLQIVTSVWPQALEEMDRSNPAAHRNAMIEAEAARLARNRQGPVIAAGSTGSVPATARLLAAIARLPMGAVVLPGLDKTLDEDAWSLIGEADSAPSAFGHPQYGLKKLLGIIGVDRQEVIEIGSLDAGLAARRNLVSQALRPAETTDKWAEIGPEIEAAIADGALDGVSLIEAANEREEALAIAIALRDAVEDRASHAALVTGDRELARRVSTELLRFGIRADDSGGAPLSRTPPGALLTLALECIFRPGDPVALLALVKHPLLRLGTERKRLQPIVEKLELVLLRGGTGRPDIASLKADLERRLERLAEERPPFWIERLQPRDRDELAAFLDRLDTAIAPLVCLRGTSQTGIAAIATASIEALEALARDENASPVELYEGDAGEKFAAIMADLVTASAGLEFEAEEWPDIATALMAGETVKPKAGADMRVSIWGALEARLQHVDTLIVGGLNEGSWPRKAEADRFMSRMMKTGMELEPPERRIGLAAHDFAMAMGAPRLILSRADRAGDAPAVMSRWLQRLTTLAGDPACTVMRRLGAVYVSWARAIDIAPDVEFVPRPNPAPLLAARPRRFSVTEIETLRRDPYAVYARKVLGLHPLDPLVRDPGAAERGTLFHEILHRFTVAGGVAGTDDPRQRLLAIARQTFDEAALPDDVEAIWWPRFVAMADEIVDWENGRGGVLETASEAAARATEIASSGVTLSGRADRIDVRPGGLADILDFKTGSSPSKRQAHTLVAPQLALEGALLKRGAFAELGAQRPADLAYVRLRPKGLVEHESILDIRGSIKTADALSEEAWTRLEKLMAHYGDANIGYLSRALPFKEGDVDGDYDHLARVLEWSAGGDTGEENGE
ncbi:double-strand break repair protein AddB [Mesorhizobium xinjiangense]|uniref:double-strand break repair protein AddB n=1 Tax=Mesorhizobium xinjiangense TaxID=2678685 RepID=UPI0012ECD519|nr:double-strand break repair protein AddB [Mesorhizobium xinjiangense]